MTSLFKRSMPCSSDCGSYRDLGNDTNSVGSELLRGRFEERCFLGFLGLTVLAEESDADESEASLIVVIWRDLRISSKGMPDLLGLGLPVVGCSGTTVRRRGLEVRGLEG